MAKRRRMMKSPVPALTIQASDVAYLNLAVPVIQRGDQVHAKALEAVSIYLTGQYSPSDIDRILRIAPIPESQGVINDMNAITPSIRFARLHRQFHQANEDWIRALELLAGGIEVNNSVAIGQAARQLNEALSEYNQATTGLRALAMQSTSYRKAPRGEPVGRRRPKPTG